MEIVNKDRKSTIEITKSQIILLVYAFFLVAPSGLVTISTLLYKAIYSYGQFLIGIVILYVFFIKYHYKRDLTKTFSQFGFFFILTFLLAIGHGFALRTWYTTFSILFYVLLLVEAYKDDLNEVIDAFYFILEMWIYINFLTMLLFPGGLYFSEANQSNSCWILGYKSSFQNYIMPGVVLGGIRSHYSRSHIRYYVLCIVSIFQSAVSGNMMLLMGLIVFVGLFNTKTYRIISIWIYYVIDLIVNGIFIIWAAWFANTQLGILFFSITRKDITFSRRSTIIWPKTIQMIKDHFVFGNGYWEMEDRVALYSNYKPAIHAHNQILEILFIGGIFLLFFYVLLHIFIGKSINEYRSYEISRILSTGIFVIYLMMTVEVLTTRYTAAMWLILILATKIDDLEISYATDA